VLDYDLYPLLLLCSFSSTHYHTLHWFLLISSFI
jgi:hypothetical protein